MAKRGRKPKAFDYKDTAEQCSKELAAKKKALVAAEKRLANAQKTHQELLSEVARLDMLDRSLNALIQGTEPPQNVKYVYTYPQWVWYPNNQGTGWWYNNGTITLGSQTVVGSNLQGGSQLYQNSQYTPNNGGPNVTLTGFNSNGGLVTNTSGLCTVNTGTGITDPSVGSSVMYTSNGGPNTDAECMVVDLTTYADMEADTVETKTEEVEDAVEVGVGG